MTLIDANYILRYLLQDVEEKFLMAKAVIEKEEITIPDFILAEVVYVLEKVYDIRRKEIKGVIEGLLNYENILVRRKDAVINSLEVYVNHKIDYADALLIAYYQSGKINKLHTFDKKILRIISSIKL